MGVRHTSHACIIALVTWEHGAQTDWDGKVVMVGSLTRWGQWGIVRGLEWVSQSAHRYCCTNCVLFAKAPDESILCFRPEQFSSEEGQRAEPAARCSSEENCSGRKKRIGSPRCADCETISGPRMMPHPPISLRDSFQRRTRRRGFKLKECMHAMHACMHGDKQFLKNKKKLRCHGHKSIYLA